MTASAVNSTTDVCGVSTVGVMLVAVVNAVPVRPPVSSPAKHRPTGDRHSGPDTGASCTLPAATRQASAALTLVEVRASTAPAAVAMASRLRVVERIMGLPFR
jgi:hypothetical protein